MNQRQLAVPAYFHPAVAAADWSRLAAAAGLVRAVILNIDSGPGDEPELELLAVAQPVRDVAPVIGYVDTHYGTRPASSVLADVARYFAWYPVTGIFFDRVASCAFLLPWYQRVVMWARVLGATQVVLNPGVVPEEPGYADIADGLVVFEGPHSAYQRFEVPSWVREIPPERFWHLVYATPYHLLDSTLRWGEKQHTETMYVTDRCGSNPWDGLPLYFDEQATSWIFSR